MSNKNGGPAFPRAYGGHPDPAPGDADMQSQEGMDLRDFFAAKANIEVYAPVDSLYRKLGRNPTVNEMAAWIAEVRFIEADAMLAQRSQP